MSSIVVSGANGFIGSALCPYLRSQGHTVRRLVRTPTEQGDIRWDPTSGQLDKAELTGIDAAVHLAGASISTRWTDAARTEILESREQGTSLIARTLAELSPRPAVLISSSAVGIYGERGDSILTEADAKADLPGNEKLFVVRVGRVWESATRPAEEAGIRVVHMRTGLVLSPEGGALKLMLTPFKLGVGGRLGTGHQYMSWIALEDLLAAVGFMLREESLRGAVNATAPNPVTNGEFTETLGRVLGRPTAIPVPLTMLRFMFGEMADELLLASARVIPARLEASGFKFRFPELEPALRHVLVR